MSDVTIAKSVLKAGLVYLGETQVLGYAPTNRNSLIFAGASGLATYVAPKLTHFMKVDLIRGSTIDDRFIEILAGVGVVAGFEMIILKQNFDPRTNKTTMNRIIEFAAADILGEMLEDFINANRIPILKDIF
jgi:hypothetical protein